MTADRLQRRHSLLLGPIADETRRSLGPLAWAALEALVTDARTNDGVTLADASVRTLAVQLGIAKNTAHRAITTLRRAGLVEPEQSRTANGSFARTAYRLTIDPSILEIAKSPAPPSASAPLSSSRRTSRRPSQTSAQLSLLPPS